MLGKRVLYMLMLVAMLGIVLVQVPTEAQVDNPDPANYRVPLIDDAAITRLGKECLEHDHYERDGITFMDVSVPADSDDNNADVGTPVYASGGGTVRAVSSGGHYGLYVIHDDGHVAFRYAHLVKAYVLEGESVSTGDLIGLLGNTGRSFGGHIHWEAWPTSGGSFSIYEIPGVNETYSNPCGLSGSIEGSPVPSNSFTSCPDYYAQGLPGVTLFDHADCQGNALRLPDEPDVIYSLAGYDFDDRVRSLYIHPGLSVMLMALQGEEGPFHCHSNDMWDLDTDVYLGTHLRIGWDPNVSDRYATNWQESAWNMVSRVLVTNGELYCFENYEGDELLFSSAVYNAGGGADTIPPVTDAYYPDPDGNNGWWVSPVMMNLSAYDEDAVAHTYFRINGGDTQEGTEVTLSADAIYNFCYWSEDVSGNTESEKCVEIKVDQTPPVTEGTATGPRDINGLFRNIVAAEMLPTDNLSGVDLVECSFDNATTWHVQNPWMFEVSGNGVHQFFCRSQDVAGNVSEGLDSGPIIIHMYAIFSRSEWFGFSMSESTNITIDGDVYSESSVRLSRNTGVYINDNLEVSDGGVNMLYGNTNVNIGHVVEDAQHVDGMNYPFSYYWSRCDQVHSDGLHMNDTGTTMEGVICVQGDFTSVATGVTGDVTFVVDGDVDFAPTCGWYYTNDPDNGMMMYATGDIVLAGNCYDTLGLVYSDGTIAVEATDIRTRGSYVADRVKYDRATGTTLTYEAAFAPGVFDLPLTTESFADPGGETMPPPEPPPPEPTPTPTEPPPPTPTPEPTPTPTPTEPPPPTPTPELTPTPTPTPEPTPTSIPTPTEEPIGWPILSKVYFSLDSSGALGGVSFDDEDAGSYDPSAGVYTMVFDDDVWDISGEIDALARVSDSKFLLSTDWTERNLPGMSQKARSSDVVKCDTQTMLCEMYFDASDVGLSDEVNGVTVMKDGSLLFVLEWYFSVGGVRGMGEDVVRFIPTSLGDNTTGSFEMFLDGSDVGIDEDIDGIWWDDALDSLCMTFEDDYETPNDLLVRDEDVVCFNATQYGALTTGSFAQDLMFDFSEMGNTANVSAIHLEP